MSRSGRPGPWCRRSCRPDPPSRGSRRSTGTARRPARAPTRSVPKPSPRLHLESDCRQAFGDGQGVEGLEAASQEPRVVADLVAAEVALAGDHADVEEVVRADADHGVAERQPAELTADGALELVAFVEPVRRDLLDERSGPLANLLRGRDDRLPVV